MNDLLAEDPPPSGTSWDGREYFVEARRAPVVCLKQGAVRSVHTFESVRGSVWDIT